MFIFFIKKKMYYKMILVQKAETGRSEADSFGTVFPTKSLSLLKSATYLSFIISI